VSEQIEKANIEVEYNIAEMEEIDNLDSVPAMNDEIEDTDPEIGADLEIPEPEQENPSDNEIRE
jgi:hypothetical protein